MRKLLLSTSIMCGCLVLVSCLIVWFDLQVREPVCCADETMNHPVTLRVAADRLDDVPNSALQEMSRQLTMPRETQPFQVLWTNARAHSVICTVVRATNGDWIFTWKP